MKKGIIFLAGFVLLFIGCRRVAGDTTPSVPVPEYTVTYSVSGGHGKLIAKTQGGETVGSKSKKPKDTVLVFTATADAGYVVDKWVVNGGKLKQGTGIQGSRSATVTLTADTTVTVTFKTKPKEADLVTVTITEPQNGTVTTDPVLFDEKKGEKNTKMTFTAIPNDGYVVDKWVVTGGSSSFEAGGKDGDESATITLTADTTVTVTFKTKPSEANLVTVTITPPTHGTVTPSPALTNDKKGQKALR